MVIKQHGGANISEDDIKNSSLLWVVTYKKKLSNFRQGSNG
jgi:hypothetical protein